MPAPFLRLYSYSIPAVIICVVNYALYRAGVNELYNVLLVVASVLIIALQVTHGALLLRQLTSQPD